MVEGGSTIAVSHPILAYRELHPDRPPGMMSVTFALTTRCRKVLTLSFRSIHPDENSIIVDVLASRDTGRHRTTAPPLIAGSKDSRSAADNAHIEQAG